MPKNDAGPRSPEHPPEPQPSFFGWLHEPFLAAASEPGSDRGRHDLGAFLTLRLADRLHDGEKHEPLAIQYQVRATAEYLTDLFPPTPDVPLMLDVVRACGVAFETGATEPVASALVAFADWLEDHGWPEQADDVLDSALAIQKAAADGETVCLLLRRARRDADRSGWSSVSPWLAAAHDIAQRLPARKRSRGRGKRRAVRHGADPADPETVLRGIVASLGPSAPPHARASAHASLGDLLAAGSRHREAVREYAAAQRLARADRERADSLLHLARSFRALGRTDAARNSLSPLLAEGTAPTLHLHALADAIELSVASGDEVSCERLRRLIPKPPDLLASPAWEHFQRRVAEALGPAGRSRTSHRTRPRRWPPGAA